MTMSRNHSVNGTTDVLCCASGQLDYFEELIDRAMQNASSKECVVQAAQYMKDHVDDELFMQIKLREIGYRRANESKIMLLYVVHELVKMLSTSDPMRLKQWHYTVDHVIHAILSCENKAWDHRVGKTIGRWAELNIYGQHVSGWGKLVNHERLPRKGPPRLPKSVNSTMPYIKVGNQSDDPLLLDAKDDDPEKLESWRYSAAFFIRSLGKSLDVGQQVILMTLYFYNRVYDRGIYGFERYRVATACLFLASKCNDSRAHIFRYIRAMYAILERPLIEGDEQVEDLERIYLLHYELEVLAALEHDVAVVLPSEASIAEATTKVLRDTTGTTKTIVQDKANAILMDLFCLPLCQSYSPQILAEGAVYVASRREESVGFDTTKSTIQTETAELFFQMFQKLGKWKQGQRLKFEQHICLKNRKKLNTGSPGSNEETARTYTASQEPVFVYSHQIAPPQEEPRARPETVNRRRSRSPGPRRSIGKTQKTSPRGQRPRSRTPAKSYRSSRRRRSRSSKRTSSRRRSRSRTPTRSRRRSRTPTRRRSRSRTPTRSRRRSRTPTRRRSRSRSRSSSRHRSRRSRSRHRRRRSISRSSSPRRRRSRRDSSISPDHFNSQPSSSSRSSRKRRR